MRTRNRVNNFTREDFFSYYIMIMQINNRLYKNEIEKVKESAREYGDCWDKKHFVESDWLWKQPIKVYT